MEITVNAQRTDVPEGTTVLELVARHCGRTLDDRGMLPDGRAVPYAVAVDGQVVPRGSWATTPLAADDAVDLVTAMPGG